MLQRKVGTLKHKLEEVEGEYRQQLAAGKDSSLSLLFGTPLHTLLPSAPANLPPFTPPSPHSSLPTLLPPCISVALEEQKEKLEQVDEERMKLKLQALEHEFQQELHQKVFQLQGTPHHWCQLDCTSFENLCVLVCFC